MQAFLFPIVTFVKIVTRKWPVLMFTFWPARQISDPVPPWFHFHNVSHSKVYVFFCLFVGKFWFLKFQPHIYAFNMKSIMMALGMHLYIEFNVVGFFLYLIYTSQNTVSSYPLITPPVFVEGPN